MLTAICTLLHLINSTINVLKQFWYFNALVVSQYVNIRKSASAVEYCAVKFLSSALILMHPPWQSGFSFNMTTINYIRYVADQHLSIQKLYFMSYYTSNEFFCSYLLYNRTLSFIVNLPRKKSMYIWKFIIVTYKSFLCLLNVHHMKRNIIFSTQKQPA